MTVLHNYSQNSISLYQLKYVAFYTIYTTIFIKAINFCALAFSNSATENF